ncbi:hypothetical protein LCGC14_0953770 [marine sediment metagenome]|uniref:Uncharacterized protein n=1 Tax=marine sediment metagenome TaxID=412755 RepID=A0A0F9P2I4_9ZZZZ
MKLKTLKDLNCISDLGKWMLRKEAIKQVKQIIEECSMYVDCEICKQKVSWINYFFNITEEELK